MCRETDFAVEWTLLTAAAAATGDDDDGGADADDAVSGGLRHNMHTGRSYRNVIRVLLHILRT